MSVIVDAIISYGHALLNEFFASTNEKEGTEIDVQIVHPLLVMKIKVFYVTHMFDLAQSVYHLQVDTALSLRAKRLDDADGHSG